MSLSPARRILLPTATETTFQDWVIREAKRCEWLVTAMRDSRDLWWGTHAGFPDVFLARGNRAVAAELKAAKGRLSASQQEWITRLTATPVETYVWKPADQDEILRVLA